MEGLIMAAQLLLSLSILIVVHEGGHFIAARMFKIKVEKFYLFFDFLFPLANVLNFSLLKFKKGDTEYGIGWFPLGGYVKIAGMVDESMDKEQMKTPAQPWEFRSKPAWQRLIVMLGGIIVNVIVGIIIFICLTYFLGDTYLPKNVVNDNGGIIVGDIGEKIGLKNGDKIIKINGADYENFDDIRKPNVLLARDAYYTVLRDGQEVDIHLPANFIENFSNRDALYNFVSYRVQPVINKITSGTIAEQVGLQPGDRVVEVNGSPIFFHDEVHKQLELANQRKDSTIAFKVERAGNVLTFNESFPEGKRVIGYAVKGLDPSVLSYTSYGLGESMWVGTKRAFGVIFIQLKALGKIFSGDVGISNSLSGPVGMAEMFGSDWDWVNFWQMTGMLSMVLAFMNLLPIPALDGGYVVFLLYEMISGREPSEKFFETALKMGMAFLLLLIVFVFYNDFRKQRNRNNEKEQTETATPKNDN
jgi:regulator of sigma E protease